MDGRMGKASTIDSMRQKGLAEYMRPKKAQEREIEGRQRRKEK